MATFVVVCEVDIEDVNNALDQVKREIKGRYDFRDSNCEIDFNKKIPSLTVTANDEYKLQVTIDILLTKLIKRTVPVKSLIYGKTEYSGRLQKKEITIQQGLSKEQCKKINQFIKSSKIKVQAQTQNESIRVTGKKKDDLQTLISSLKNKNFDFDLQFTNFR